ncbi:HWE histidine kinase domain-containing protein [Erythrobacter litoralis]|uniref:HWE histidine kinase domain-containing protein n=1 Tax=Erythrobacter litoralis TaxID=39960 RepID=UPI0024355D5A|nr:HWE histidine kinase domain-containing protein [Erythrobacter litoralis]
MADRDGRILHGNSNIERMLGHPVRLSADADSYEEWVGYHEDGRRVASGDYPLAQVIRGKADHSQLDVDYEHGDGSRSWIRAIAEPIRDESGERVGAAVAVIDIDEERRLQDNQRLLIAELNHRVKNAFSVTQAIVNRSLRGTVNPEFLERLDRRLSAYAQAHAGLLGKKIGRVSFDDILDEAIVPIDPRRLKTHGAEVDFSSPTGVAFAMTFYELTTNSRRHGALSDPAGTVSLTWNLKSEKDGQRLIVTWQESGGPHPKSLPEGNTFGAFITQRAIAAETRGTVEWGLEKDGLRWELDMPYTEQGLQ